MPGRVTKNKRYEAHYDAMNDGRIAEATQTTANPVTLPMQAYGQAPIEWSPHGRELPVWAWVQWPDRPAQRIECLARGWNDRVVIIEWEAAGGRRSVVVWRNAVTRRGHAKNAPSQVP